MTMRIEDNTVHKCIHEAMDLAWCDCTNETRKDLNVTLPKPGPLCEACDDPAFFVLHMSDSVSMDNLYYACRQCTSDILGDWMWADAHYEHVDGWEVRKL